MCAAHNILQKKTVKYQKEGIYVVDTCELFVAGDKAIITQCSHVRSTGLMLSVCL